MLSDDELLRYHRQILLPNWDVAGQEALRSATVMIVGLGGLGSVLSQYLVAAGVGCVKLVDFDRVEVTNLQRQPIHNEASVGVLKVDSAAQALRALNSYCQIETCSQALNAENFAELSVAVDVIADCCDNFATRDLINALAWPAGIPVVSAAAIGWQGQLAVFDPRQANSACYRCVYPAVDEEGASCSEVGVMASTVAVMGSWQAQEVLKVIANIGQSLVGQLLLWDGFSNEVRRLRTPRDPNCAVCAHPFCAHQGDTP
ncbi:MAG: molybdopterin-synthase adenylyltransferase MoeB [Moraxellaceae bacterium]|nr:molybdopterin-synthase adenylyltransferase MoeB [Moraxellaceae bacterium]MDZ4298414.1 molybdopterin-synthase adenylyltransferase MoeB [Moraxellaceae bacterium]MDZ4388009.1 molybdopterin-synthase adenylyltransferase MoeB [Moraxellaceae bacterium]